MFTAEGMRVQGCWFGIRAIYIYIYIVRSTNSKCCYLVFPLPERGSLWGLLFGHTHMLFTIDSYVSSQGIAV